MPDKAVTAKTTWEEFFDARRNSQAFQDREQEVISGTFQLGPDKPAVELTLVSQDHWTFGTDDFFAVGAENARELVAGYALYRRAVLKKGGEPTAFNRPTKDGFDG